MQSVTIRRALLCGLGGALVVTVAGAAKAEGAAVSAAAENMIIDAEIVVTARKRNEVMQDVPIAIRVIDDKTIEREGLRTVEDLSRQVPGLTYDMGGFLNDTRPAIRGMQSERGRPSVAILLDGLDLSGENMVIAGGGAAVNTQLFDLERIEVVKGPQSVLWGRNAFAGAINFVSRSPQMELEGRVNAEIAGGGLYAIDGAINLPLIKDRVALRVNGVFSDRDGFYRNPVTGGKLGANRTEGLGAALLVKIADGLDLTARYIRLDQRMSEMPTALLTANTRLPVPGGRFAPAPGAPSILPCPANLAGLSPPQQVNCTRGTFAGAVSAREQDIDLSADPFTGAPMRGMTLAQDIATLQLRWTGDWGSLTYRFGHLDNESTLEQDGDYSNFAGPPGFVLSLNAFQVLDFRNRTFDHELRFNRRFGKVDVLIGGQIFSETSSVTNRAQFWLRNSASPLAGPPFFLSSAPKPDFAFPQTTERNTDYVGVYASAEWEMTDRLKLAAEVRWNYEELRFAIPGFRIQDVSLSQLVPVCLPGQANGSLPGPGQVVACPRDATLKSERLTPRFTLEYRASDDVLLYASFSEGFKPGGYNTNEIIEFNDQQYQPERVKAYEAGIKSMWLDNRLTLNADAYFNDYTDQQIGVQQASTSQGGAVVVGSGIVNAGKVRIYGAEVDLDLRATDWLRLGVNYAYTHATFERFVQGPPPGSPAQAFTDCGVPSGQSSSDQFRAEAGNICGDFSGNDVGRSPRHAVFLTGEVRQPLGSSGASWFTILNGQGRSQRFVDEANLSTLPGYWRVGARIGVEWRNSSILAYVDNIFDNRTIETTQRTVDPGRSEGFAPARALLAYLPSPRVFGVRLGTRF